MLGLGAGLFAVVVALAVNPVMAPLVPLAILITLTALSLPTWGGLLLVLAAYPDALVDRVLFMVPGAPYKLIAMMTILGLILRIRGLRDDLGTTMGRP